VTAVELAEPAFRLNADGVSVALVDELARLAVFVRPDRRAVDCHGEQLTRMTATTPRRRMR
jgi:hypothetical protein